MSKQVPVVEDAVRRRNSGLKWMRMMLRVFSSRVWKGLGFGGGPASASSGKWMCGRVPVESVFTWTIRGCAMWGWDQPSQRTPVARETARLRATALCNVFPARGAWTNRLHGGAPCWSSEFGALGNHLHPTSALQNSRGIEIWQYHPARHQCRFSHSVVCPFCFSGVILVPFHCLPP